MPAISIVIPAYNAEHFIAETIDSVLGQSFQDIELIIVDDGSTDGTAALIARNYPSVKLISKPNGGVSSARNAGVRAASSEWIAFVDSDDIWHPDKLRDQYRLMQHYPDCALGITLSNSQTRDHLRQTFVDQDGLPPHVLKTDFSEVFLWPYLGMSGVFVRKADFDKVGGLDQSLPFAEDIDFYLRLLYQQPKWVRLEYPAVYVRPRPGSLSSNALTGYMQLLDVYKRFLAKRPEFAQQQPAVVKRAMADLYMRTARSQLWQGQHQAARHWAWASWQGQPSREALTTFMRACIPLSFKNLVKRKIS
jgi:glycosyltransferase involved in cell wall biosynthesis